MRDWGWSWWSVKERCRESNSLSQHSNTASPCLSHAHTPSSTLSIKSFARLHVRSVGFSSVTDWCRWCLFVCLFVWNSYTCCIFMKYWCRLIESWLNFESDVQYILSQRTAALLQLLDFTVHMERLGCCERRRLYWYNGEYNQLLINTCCSPMISVQHGRGIHSAEFYLVYLVCL